LSYFIEEFRADKDNEISALQTEIRSIFALTKAALEGLDVNNTEKVRWLTRYLAY